jgi:glutamine amidotransferase
VGRDNQNMIGVIDYGLGNVKAILNIYGRLGMAAMAVRLPAELEQCSHLILPGVGAFDWAVSRLEQSGLKVGLKEAVLARELPVLGICVGMQMLADSSDEGELSGLGWIPGVVKKFSAANLPLPHMGWNSVEPMGSKSLFASDASAIDFYFLHSFYFEPAADEHVLASTSYGGTFASAVRRGHIFGVQFHPEKSHGAGIDLLKNFAEYSAC